MDKPVQNSQTQLLLRLCAQRGGEPGAPEFASIDGELLLRLASRHRVIPVVYAGLKQLNAQQALPPEMLAKFRGYVQGNAGSVLRQAGEFRRLLGEFDRAAIPVIPFKGLALAAQVYGELSMRDAGDLDLLVHRDDIVRASDLLVSLGHHPIFPTSTPREAAYLEGLSGDKRTAYLRWHCEHHLVYAPTQLNVDLHWAMSLREFSVSLDIDGIWSRARRASVAGREVLTLADEDLLIVLCLNGAKDCWGRLDRACDVARLLENSANSMDWATVFRHATGAGVARMVRLGLRLAAALLAAPLPPEARRFVEQDREVERVAREIRTNMFDSHAAAPSKAERTAFDLRMRERWIDRAHYCVAQLRPGVGDWAAVPLPKSLSFLHYVIRPFRLAWRHLWPTPGHGA